MKRRAFLSTTATTTVLLAGCTESDSEPTPTDTNPSTSENTETGTETNPITETQTQTSTESGPEYDTVIEYTTHIQDSASGEYNLPAPPYDDWSWIVMDFEVIEGQLDMEDVWFDGLFETEERYYTVSKETDTAENGIEPRGAIREGSRGVTLHEYPPSPGSELVGPMFSATDTRIGGEGVGTDGPLDLYPPVTVEYSVETAQNPDVLPREYAAESGNVWAVVNLNVVEGVLNLEDVWFRSQLTTSDRLYDCHHSSQFADRGVRSRGIVKPGYTANALYQIADDESVEEWGYQDDGRQSVTIRQA